MNVAVLPSSKWRLMAVKMAVAHLSKIGRIVLPKVANLIWRSTTSPVGEKAKHEESMQFVRIFAVLLPRLFARLPIRKWMWVALYFRYLAAIHVELFLSNLIFLFAKH